MNNYRWTIGQTLFGILPVCIHYPTLHYCVFTIENLLSQFNADWDLSYYLTSYPPSLFRLCTLFLSFVFVFSPSSFVYQIH